MARRELTEAEKEERRIAKEEMQATRRPYNKKTEPNQNNMEGDKNTNTENQENTNNGTNNTDTNNNTESNQGQNTNPVNTEEKTTNTGSGDNSNFQPQTGWKPFGGNKIERDYSTPKIDQNLLNTPIPEVDITSQTPTTETSTDILKKPITDTNVSGPGTVQPTQKPAEIKPIVSDWNTLSPDEQKNAAAQTTDMVLGVYDKLHYFGRLAIKVDDEEIIEAHNDDLIDMRAPTVENDEDPEKEVSIQDFWKDFNKQVDERFVVSDQFKAAVRPPMERLCMKYGLGASDGIFLAFKFGEDAATKIAMLVGFKKTVNSMKEHFEKQHSKFKAAVDKEVRKQRADEEAAQKQMDALNKKENPQTNTDTTKTNTTEKNPDGSDKA